MANYITIDGGTTNTRVSLVKDYEIIGTVKISLGARSGIDSKEPLKNAIKDGIEKLLSDNDLSENDITRILAAGMIPLAVIGSIVIGIVLMIFANKKTHTNPYIVVIRCDNHNTEMQAKAFLDKQVGRCVVKSKSAQKGMIELNMEIRLKDDNTDFVNVLADMKGVQSAVLVSYNGDYMS